MDRERLTELLQDPAQVAAGDLGDLRSMTERFPWFSGAHLLLAVGEHAKGDVLSNDPVRTPAAYLPSRAVLFDLIQAEEAPAPPPMHVVKDLQPTVPLPASQPVVMPPVIEVLPSVIEGPPSVAEETRPILPDIPFGSEAPALHTPVSEQLRTPPVDAEVSPPVIQGPVAVAEKVRPILSESAIDVTEEIVPPSAPAISPAVPDPLESQMREAIMASGYDVANIPPPPIEPRDAAPAPPVAHKRVPSLPPLVAPEVSVAQPIQPAARITKGSRLRFTDWLTSSGDIAPEPVVATAPRALVEEAVSVPSPSQIAPLASGSLQDPKEIIERFIQQATPVAAPVKAEFFTPQQAAKRSLMDDGLVSETLAKIYEQQGDIAKAKAAYARLAIIHPGKSVYFAALSKALEGRSNK